MENFGIKIDNDDTSAGEVVAREYNSLFNENKNAVSPFIDLDSADDKQLVKAIDISSKAMFYTDTGTANAVELSRGATTETAETLFDGMVVLFEPANANTGATTLKINTLNAKPLKYNGLDLKREYLKTGIKYIAIYSASSETFNVEMITGLDESSVNVDWFGAKGDKTTDDTVAIQKALDSFSSPLGGIVKLSPSKRYKVSNLTIPTNVKLTCDTSVQEQDEGSLYGYDKFFGGVLFVSGVVLLEGHGSNIENIAILASHLNGYTIPTSDAEANTLVANYTGTAIRLTGTGTNISHMLVLGFEYALVDNGNRTRIDNLRFDCTNGLDIGGASDVSRIFDCHGWPYLTAELGLSSSVNYRSGTAYRLRDNSDKFSFRDIYAYGYEIGFHIGGQLGQIVQSCSLFGIHMDSGYIGGTGTSVGFKVSDYVSDLDIYEISVQNYDINIEVNTRGAYITAERLNKIKFHGGKLLDSWGKFADIINGYVLLSGVSFQKGGNSTVGIEWTSTDGGLITGCDFEEMFAGAGDGSVINFTSTLADKNTQRFGNKQADTIAKENMFLDGNINRVSVDSFFNLKRDTTALEISSAGNIYITGSYHLVDTELQADTDDLVNIYDGNDGDILMLRAASSTRDVTLVETGNLALAGSFTLANATDRILLTYDSSLSKWVEISRSTN